MFLRKSPQERGRTLYAEKRLLLKNVFAKPPKVVVSNSLIHENIACRILLQERYLSFHRQPDIHVEEYLTESTVLQCTFCTICELSEALSYIGAVKLQDQVQSLRDLVMWDGTKDDAYLALVSMVCAGSGSLFRNSWRQVGATPKQLVRWERIAKEILVDFWYPYAQEQLLPAQQLPSSKDAYTYVLASPDAALKLLAKPYRRKVRVAAHTFDGEFNYTLLHGPRKSILTVNPQLINALPSFYSLDKQRVEETVLVFIKDGLTPFDALKVALSLA